MNERSRAAASVASLVLAVTMLGSPAIAEPAHASAAADASDVGRSAVTARAVAPAQRVGGEARSPSGPPLAGQQSSGEPAAAEGGEGGSPQAEADPLVSNGLGSPLCRATPEAHELPSSSRRNCETSGFVGSASQTGELGIDVHIDTGLLGLSSGGLLVTVQDLCVTPVWMALVWAVHALLVMLEWCFTLDLLDSASVQLGLAHGLRQMQAAFTIPWLATVLSLAAVLTAYDGLVRRRVAETLGRALLTLAMIAAGFWVMLDPTGTVGALGEWANQASLGTLAATAGGAPTAAGRSLADGMRAVFSTAIEVPWCYLEFGDVGWCRDPRRLDPSLRTAALALANKELAQGAGAGSGGAKSLKASAALLRAARTNGAIFLALPANGPARNSINESRSLLRAICQSDDATSCHGSAAAEAEFRTNDGTWPRVGGLLLIVAGVLGMLLLFGFVALRLLTAALFSLLYLMLTPVAVLTPALGENGRAAFRKWGTQLLGAVVSKLLFSFLLGAILVVLNILADLDALGWWTQWLLMSAFWWTAFARRKEALQFAGATKIDGRGRGGVLRRVNDVVEPRRRLRERAREARGRRRGRMLDAGSRAAVSRRPALARGRLGPGVAAPKPPPEPHGDAQARRLLEVESRVAPGDDERSAQVEARLASFGTRLERIGGEHATALAAGDTRRAASLRSRSRTLEMEIAYGREELAVVKSATGRHAPVASPGRDERAREQEHARFLDAQAALAPARAGHRSRARERRDYVALARLVGYAGHEYRRLDEPKKRVARIAIDRELALRKSVQAGAAGRSTQPGDAAARSRHSAAADPYEGRREGQTPARRAERSRPARRAASESSVMRDVREVEAGRKRQLGYDRP
jgi:hypothetical protein